MNKRQLKKKAKQQATQTKKQSPYVARQTKKAEQEKYASAYDKLYKETAALAQKAKRRYEPYRSRKLYLHQYETLAQSIDRINPEAFEGNIFGMSRSFSVSQLQMRKTFYERFLARAPKFAETRAEQKSEGKTLGDWAAEKEALNYGNKAAEELGSPVVGELYSLVRDDKEKYEEIKNAFYSLKDTNYKYISDKLQHVADRLSGELAERVLAYI